MTDADRKAFFAAYGRLATALRDKDPDPIAIRTYFDGLRDLEIEFVTAAAESLARRAEYGFPKVPDWRREAQRIHVERAAAQRAFLRRLPRPLCSACSDTGWREIPPANDPPAPRIAAPCPCREQRRLELLGRVASPALPVNASPTVDDRPLTHEESVALRAAIPPMKPPITPARTFARRTSDAGAAAIAKRLVEQIAPVEEAEAAAAEHERTADTTEGGTR
jgi:hypothetical protein